MNSYANPAHEEAAAQALRALLPDVYVTCSTELTREWYEYERTSTVAANAYVGPQVTRYIRRLRDRPAGQGLRRLAVHDGLERRVALGRAQLRAAGGAGGIRTDRRLHRRRRLCGGARLPQCHRLRHGRHHGEMRAGRERPLLGRTRSITRAATCRASRSSRRSSTSSRSAPAAARSPGSIRRTACMSGRKAPARRRARPATATAAPSRP